MRRCDADAHPNSAPHAAEKRRWSANDSVCHSAWLNGRMRSITLCHGKPCAAAARACWRSVRMRARSGITSNGCGSNAAAPPCACGNGNSPCRDTTCIAARCACAANVTTVSAMLKPEPTMHTAASCGTAATAPLSQASTRCARDNPVAPRSGSGRSALPTASTTVVACNTCPSSSCNSAPSAVGCRVCTRAVCTRSVARLCARAACKRPRRYGA